MVEYGKEKYGVLDWGKLGNESHKDDLISTFSHVPIVLEISGPYEKCVEGHISAPHEECARGDSFDDYAFCLIMGEAFYDDIHEC